MTPGELLREEFLVPMALSQYRLAKEIGVPPQRIGEIIAGKRAITADTDLRLCRFFGLSNGYWLRAQAAYDTEVAEDAAVLEAHEEVLAGRLHRCDAYAFEYATLKERFDRWKLPHLKLEAEATPSSIEQLNVRVQSFIESLL